MGTPLPGLTRHTGEQRPYPPGQHGPGLARARRPSTYSIGLREKQKLRFHYGLTERQLENYLAAAARRAGPTGLNLLLALERRLDNVVFRLGLAPTIPAARQLVTHGHILINGKRVSMPGRDVHPGDAIAVDATARHHPHVVAGGQHGPALQLPAYLERSADGAGGRVTTLPTRPDVGLDVDENVVVEFYAR